MIESINKMLEEIGSKYRTTDGKTISTYLGNLKFLKRTFDSIDDCYNFVKHVYDGRMKIAE